MDREQIVEFFNNNLTQLPDLTQMHDMQKTADRIITAIENNEKLESTVTMMLMELLHAHCFITF